MKDISMQDWYKTLQQIRETEISNAVPAKETFGRVDDLLKNVEAHQLLRDLKRFLLGGVGKIELFEDASGYDLVLALMWDGPISQAALPKTNSKTRRHIFIGVRDGGLYVNGKTVPSNTKKALQEALIEAAKNPGLRKELV
jgi:hypothetical protein